MEVAMRALRAVSIALLVAIFGWILYMGWERHGPNQTEVTFGPGGKVELELSAGGYAIQGTQENTIHVDIDRDETRVVRCQIQVSGKNAKVQIEGPSNNFKATIYVPQRSELKVDQTIGDLRVENIEGDKRLTLNIGKMEVHELSTAPLPSFDGSVNIGNVRANGVAKGGFFRDLTVRSSSPYSIVAHVDIGDLEVDASSKTAIPSDTHKSGDTDEDMPEKDSDDDSE
jgi:hypothetical protein